MALGPWCVFDTPVIGFPSYRCEIVRTITSDPSQSVETRLINKLLVCGAKFREELSLETWKGDRLQNRERFVAVCDGKRRVSFAVPNASGPKNPRAFADNFSTQDLRTLPCDPLWLTDSAPMLSSAREAENLPAALASARWWERAPSKDGCEIAVLEPHGNVRRWSMSIGAGERIPTRIDGPARLKVTATLSQQTFAGWRPLTGAVRRSAALGGKTADSLTVVTAKVASFALDENLAEAAFAFALPQGMELEDRAAEPTKATAAPKGD